MPSPTSLRRYLPIPHVSVHLWRQLMQFLLLFPAPLRVLAGAGPGRVPAGPAMPHRWRRSASNVTRVRPIGVRLFSQEGFRVLRGGFPHLGELTGLYDDDPPSCDNAPSGTRKPSPVRTRALPDTTTLLPGGRKPSRKRHHPAGSPRKSLAHVTSWASNNRGPLPNLRVGYARAHGASKILPKRDYGHGDLKQRLRGRPGGAAATRLQSIRRSK